MKDNLAQSIEAILFAVSEPQSLTSLSSRLNVGKDEINAALVELEQKFEGHGIMLVRHNDSATLVTRPEQGTLIETIRKEELNKELSKASAETLSVICYHPDATRAQIEFIRGVNASYSLRTLQMRGLVEQKGSGRSVTYVPSMATLEHFGVQSVEQLPNFDETKQKINSLLERSDKLEAEA